MSNIYEQRFFSALKDTFIGHPIKGKSGYVNLMDLKAQYFAEIEPYIKAEIDKQIEAKYREELFEKLYNFFDCYLNETGTVFFANSQIHKNLYEKVYSDRDDVALFWKTQKLYYVKSEANYDDLQTEVNGINIKFDASEIKHAKGNEKKSIRFFMVKATKDEVVFKIRYQEQSKYDRLKEYAGLKSKNDLPELLEKFGTEIHPNIFFEPTEMDTSVFTRKTDQKECIYFENLDDAIESVKVEYSISDLSLMLQYLHKNGVILYEEDLKKIFSIYKRQNEIDYFIHKDALGFLKEQFDIYVYNWLFNDLDTDFDAATVKRMQNIKKITHKVIEYIARFEDELKAIWEKPKFVRNCNYVLTLDRLSEETLQKVLKFNLSKQIDEWLELKFIEEDFNLKNIENDFQKFKTLPLDTKHLSYKEKITLLMSFDNILNELDGLLIKSDNWQALNTIKNLYNEKIDLIYIDPPFNTGSDFDFKDKYQDTTWLTLMDNKLQLSYDFLNSKSNFYMQLDHIAEHYGKILLDNLLGVENFMAKITWNTGDNISGFKSQAKNWIRQADYIHYYKFSDNYYFRKAYEVLNKTEKIGWLDIIGQKDLRYIEKWENNKLYKQPIDLRVKAKGTIWNDIYSFQYSEPRITESFSFVSNQKPENLLRRIIQTSCEINGWVLDFFNGSGTTTAVSHKLSRKYIGIEMGEHFNEFYFDTEGVKKVGVLGRMKIVLNGDSEFYLPNTDEKRRPHLTKDIDWQGGGFFKYYELEQYEEVLANAQYQWQGKAGENQVEQYSFMQDQKLLEAIEIDYKKKNAKVVFEKLYPDVDIAETLSNLSGHHIRQLFEDRVILDDGSHDGLEIIYDKLTFEEYPWIRPLIWWNSK